MEDIKKDTIIKGGLDKPAPEPVKENVADNAALKGLMDKVKELSETNSMLLQVADKKALALYYARNRRDLPKEVRLRTLNGKVVVGWKSVKDVVEKNPLTGVWQEDQRVKVLLEDGSSEELPLAIFFRNYSYIVCQRTGVITDEATGGVIFTLKSKETGREYKVAAAFVN